MRREVREENECILFPISRPGNVQQISNFRDSTWNFKQFLKCHI